MDSLNKELRSALLENTELAFIQLASEMAKPLGSARLRKQGVELNALAQLYKFLAEDAPKSAPKGGNK